MIGRRDFLKQTGLVAGAVTLGVDGVTRRAPGTAEAASFPSAPRRREMDAATRELLLHALDAAKIGGAAYADARIGRYRRSSIATREDRVTNVTDSDTIGCGVRMIVDGTWGFAATRVLTKDGVARAAREAAAIAKANRVARDRRVELAPAPAHRDVSWQSDFTIDPWTVPVEQKADLLLKVNAAALGVPGVRFVSSSMTFVKEERNYANTDGSIIAQTVVRTTVPITITAISADRSSFATRGPEVIPPLGRGYEYVLEASLAEKAPGWAEQAVEKLTAKPVEVGRYDLVLHPSQLFLTIHEAMGHPTELDRAMGYEANYAGTSFIAPPDQVLGKLRLGPEFMNIQGDRSQGGACATIGYDDDGVQPDDFLIVKDGVFNDYQTTRDQAMWLQWWYDRQGIPTRSHGCSHADSWSSVQFQRMPNVSLLPGERDLAWDDLIAATDRGLAFIGRSSYSIDQQRYNAQFGAQVVYEIRGGRIVGMVKDAVYQMRTPEFWNSLDMLGGRRSYELWTSFFDGKGEPGQVNAVTHGCPPARFRRVSVINTGRQG